MTSFMAQNMQKLTATSMPVRSTMLRSSVQILTILSVASPYKLMHSLRPWGIKNVGDNAIDRLIRERNEQVYTDIVDFCQRVDNKVVNKRFLESLIRCGAMDGFKGKSKSIIAICMKGTGCIAKEQKDAAMGTMRLFRDIEESVDFIPVPNVEDLSEDDKLKDEKEYTGFTLRVIHCRLCEGARGPL